MEYVAAGDVDAEGIHMLSTGGMLSFARESPAGTHRDRRDRDRDAAPAAAGGPRHEFIAANEAAHCRYMKMITLPKLRDSLRDGARVQGADGDRRARTASDRADGRDLITDGRTPSGGNRRRSEAVSPESKSGANAGPAGRLERRR